VNNRPVAAGVEGSEYWSFPALMTWFGYKTSKQICLERGCIQAKNPENGIQLWKKG